MTDYLKIPIADLIGYSMGGGIAMQLSIRGFRPNICPRNIDAL